MSRSAPLARYPAAVLRRLMLVMGLVLAPLALGPAFSPLVMALGGGPEHLCACGMKEGTCGCAECAVRAGRAGLAEGDTRLAPPLTHAVLGSCDDHGSRPLAGGLPPCVVPATLAILSAGPFDRLPDPVPLVQIPLPADPPPTRPPRSLEADPV